MTADGPNLEPIRMSVEVPLSQDRAFALFTERIETWWPLDVHAVRKEEVATCFVEPFAGGRMGERSRTGDEYVWADILVLERPHRLVVSWHPNDSPATELEITFTPSDRGTLVELEHRNWEAFAELALQARTEYGRGWPLVIAERFAVAAEKAAAKGESHAS